MSDTVIRRPLMSGHCAFPQTDNPSASHERCEAQGGGSRANPAKEFIPCPCPCHYGEEYQCGSCGLAIREALLWPFDEDGDIRYTHVTREGRAIGEECGTSVSGNPVLTVSTAPDETAVALAAIEAEADEPDEYAALLAELDEEV